MAERALAMAREHAPWRQGAPWWVTGIQGVVLVIVGLYLLLAPAAAAGLIFQIVAVILLVESILRIIAELRAPGSEADRYGLLQAGIGATVGILLVLRDWLLPDLDAGSARNILGFGLVAYALVGLAAALLARGEGESWLRPLANALLLIVLAIALLTVTASNVDDRLGLLGWIALIGGAVYLFLAWRARDRAAAA